MEKDTVMSVIGVNDGPYTLGGNICERVMISSGVRGPSATGG